MTSKAKAIALWWALFIVVAAGQTLLTGAAIMWLAAVVYRVFMGRPSPLGFWPAVVIGLLLTLLYQMVSNYRDEEEPR